MEKGIGACGTGEVVGRSGGQIFDGNGRTWPDPVAQYERVVSSAADRLRIGESLVNGADIGEAAT